MASRTLLALLVSLCGAVPSPKYIDRDGKAEIALCVLDVNQAVYKLGQAGNALNAAIKSCERPIFTAKKRALCAATTSDVVASLLDMASFISLAASDCASSVNLPAYCAADVMGFVASLAMLADAGASVSNSCTGRIGGPSSEFGRRLEGSDTAEEEYSGNVSVASEARQLSNFKEAALAHIAHELIQERKAEISECVFDVGQSALFLARAGMAINAAVDRCDNFRFYTKGRPAYVECAVDITGIIASFANVAEFISFATSHCPLGKNVKALCAADISKMVAGLGQFSAAAISFQETCGHHEDGYHPGVYARRLAEGNATAPSVLV